jgi:hypothetical protein
MASRTLHYPSPRHAAALYAGREENLVHAERTLGVRLISREDWLRLEGDEELHERATMKKRGFEDWGDFKKGTGVTKRI